MAEKPQRFYNNALILMILGIILIIGIIRLSSGEDTHPCSKNRYPGSCYELDRDVCMKQWDSTQEACNQQINALNLPPARLTGPIHERCQRSKFDRVFHYLRKQNANCDTEFQELELWRKSNPDF